MIELDNQTTHHIPIDFLESIALLLTSKNIELLIVDDNTIKEINKQQRGINKSTDVLSFPYLDIDIVGSIVISYDKVTELSNKLGHSKDDELKLLFIHGLLHNIGYDHEIDNGQMREQEIKIIKNFNLPDSLIVRNS